MHLGIAFRELVNRLEDGCGVGPRPQPDDESADFTGGGTGRHRRSPISVCHDRSRFSKKCPAGFGELHVAFRSRYEGRLQMLLETLELMAERRLRNTQGPSGTPKVQRVGQGDE